MKSITTRKKSTIIAISLVFFICFATLSGCNQKQTDEDKNALKNQVVFLFTNDVHGKIQHTDNQIGYSGVAAAKKNMKAKGADVFLFDAGDAFHGSVAVNMSKGKEAVNIMNLAGYDAACPGNHEFDWGVDNFLSTIESARYPYLCANIFDSKTGLLILPEHTMFETSDGLKIGVFGLDTPETKSKSNVSVAARIEIPQGKELAKCAQLQVEALKEEGADFIVCLGHLGDLDDSEGNRAIDIVSAVDGIDLFIDGHSHSYYDEGIRESDTLIVSSGYGSQALGYAAYSKVIENGSAVGLVCNATGMIDADKYLHESVMANGSFPAVDEQTDNYVNKVIEETNQSLDVAFAKNEVYLNGEVFSGVRSTETNLGDLCTDAMLWKSREIFGENIDAAIVNGGTLRKSLEPGDVTYLDIVEIIPYDNTIICLEIFGKELLEVLEAATYMTPEPIGGFCQVSGIEFIIDTTKEWIPGELYPDSVFYKPEVPGTRVTITSVGNEPFDPEKKYSIAVTSFIGGGGDQFHAMKACCEDTGRDTEVLVSEALQEYIENALNRVIGEKYQNPAGRITILS